jgi:hypothetical protein
MEPETITANLVARHDGIVLGTRNRRLALRVSAIVASVLRGGMPRILGFCAATTGEAIFQEFRPGSNAT